jgi:hypothetical protein
MISDEHLSTADNNTDFTGNDCYRCQNLVFSCMLSKVNKVMHVEVAILANSHKVQVGLLKREGDVGGLYWLAGCCVLQIYF